MSDPIAAFKAKQRAGWANFGPLAIITTPAAGRLVRFANVRSGQHVLDVGCGTGVAALSARRRGAKVTGLDLTPELLAEAKTSAAMAGIDDVDWREGDAEDLPFPGASFDVVLSQFGHMFAPRPEVATKEMLRVLKPGGTIAFHTWPPELGFATIFAITSRYAGGPPPGIAPTPQWGDVGIVRERLGASVRDVVFDRDDLLWSALSPAHYRHGAESSSGPIRELVARLQREDPAKLAAFRKEIDDVVMRYFDPDTNTIRFGYLATRATKN